MSCNVKSIVPSQIHISYSHRGTNPRATPLGSVSCLSKPCVHPSAGAHVGGKRRPSTETVGAAPPRGWTSTQRHCGLAQHEELDLQTLSPLMSPEGLFQEEPAQTGTVLSHLFLSSRFFLPSLSSSPLFVSWSCTNECLRSRQTDTQTSLASLESSPATLLPSSWEEEGPGETPSQVSSALRSSRTPTV